jgi:acyl transferase domain-containing protein
VATQQADTIQLPDDREALLALARTLLAERNREKQRAQQQAQQLEELQVELRVCNRSWSGSRSGTMGPARIAFVPRANYCSCF